MSSAAQSLSIAMLVAASGLSIVSVFGIRHRVHPGARGFILAMGAAAAWTIILAINIYPLQFLPGHVSMTLRNGLILLIVIGWAWLAVEYVRRERLTLRPVLTAIVLFIPVLTVFLTATNPLHNLAISPATPADIGGGPQIVWGPWHLIFMAYAFTMSLVPASLLLQDLRTAHGARRRQIMFLLAGFFVGFLGVNDYLLTGAMTGIPEYVRVSPFTFLIAGGLWSLALFRYQLFGFDPVSRRAVVETIPDPIVTVSPNGTIVDLNSAAIEELGLSESVVGKNVEALRSVASTVVDQYYDDEGSDEAPIDVTVNYNGKERYYSVRIKPIGNSDVGSTVVFREVTVLKTYEEKLKAQRDRLNLLNQVVRHDVRNDMQVVHGRAQILKDHIDEEGKVHLREVIQATEGAIELTKTARDLTETMLHEEEELKPISLDRELNLQIEEMRSQYDSAVIRTDGRLPTVDVQADEMLEAIFRNLLQNAIVHNDKEIPEVTVGVELQNGAVRVQIADNGPGIPDNHKEDVFGKGEKGLDSPGTGLGLYLVKTLVENYGGEVWIEDNDPEGAVFVVEFPKAG